MWELNIVNTKFCREGRVSTEKRGVERKGLGFGDMTEPELPTTDILFVNELNIFMLPAQLNFVLSALAHLLTLGSYL